MKDHQATAGSAVSPGFSPEAGLRMSDCLNVFGLKAHVLRIFSSWGFRDGEEEGRGREGGKGVNVYRCLRLYSGGLFGVSVCWRQGPTGF